MRLNYRTRWSNRRWRTLILSNKRRKPKWRAYTSVYLRFIENARRSSSNDGGAKFPGGRKRRKVIKGKERDSRVAIATSSKCNACCTCFEDLLRIRLWTPRIQIEIQAINQRVVRFNRLWSELFSTFPYRFIHFVTISRICIYYTCNMMNLLQYFSI